MPHNLYFSPLPKMGGLPDEQAEEALALGADIISVLGEVSERQEG